MASKNLPYFSEAEISEIGTRAKKAREEEKVKAEKEAREQAMRDRKSLEDRLMADYLSRNPLLTEADWKVVKDETVRRNLETKPTISPVLDRSHF